ncbi:MAG: flagellar biosynthesis anti-sigma factor FlgM [Bacteroidota bacterium]
MIVSTGEVITALSTLGKFKKTGVGRRLEEPAQDEVVWCKAAVFAMTFVRPERIGTIKAAISAASYIIDDYQVATKMVERSLVDTFFANST